MHYLVNQEHDYTVRGYLESPRSRALACSIDLLYYHQARDWRRLPATTYIFSDHERLTQHQTELTIQLWNQLEGHAGVRLLNNPARVARRYELLRKLYESGRNDFNVFRLDEPLDQVRFPVFVREEREHDGSLTELIHDADELCRRLKSLLSPLQNYRSRDLIVVEFCDTSNGEGVYAKYSALKIGERLIPRYLQFSQDWEIKDANAIVSAENMAREMRYFKENPHESWIRKTFEVARIDYGRLDYGVLGERPQVWEINTNPMLAGMPRNKKRFDRPDWKKDLLEPSRQLSHQRIRDALETIESSSLGRPEIPIRISTALARSLRREEIIHQLGRPLARLKRLLNSFIPRPRV